MDGLKYESIESWIQYVKCNLTLNMQPQADKQNSINFKTVEMLMLKRSFKIIWKY